MNVIIVNCFDTYEHRVDLVYDFFVQAGHEVLIVQSDFRHFKKIKRTDTKKDFMFIPTKPYYKNLSIDRMYSHYLFAKKAFECIETMKPDLLYVMLPPNSLAKFANKYKMKYPNTKLYFDIIDLWPETMPLGKIEILPPFTSWRRLRDKNLKNADYIITECDLYREVLNKQLKKINHTTLHLARNKGSFLSKPNLEINIINLCYLGSINNIIDIPFVVDIISRINKIKPVCLHIIGDGENRDTLISEVKKTGAKVEYYGNIYDSVQKQEIFDVCHFGLNIMKESVCVGLTMKSIDYFEAGLPIINNIRHDTIDIVSKYKTGYNINNKNIDVICKQIGEVEEKDLMLMRKNSRSVFELFFSREAFNQKLNELINL